ncbi:DUF3168 domain-containing protein [Spirosoma sp. 209]|uniref:tail completion protein gp17 n=1 Tax=Spirosoma sp. 209 TaxID=1955701 RepID=UPI00098D2CA1|nr:DUF3168 domain-containing protein [Spirosoma sp. 209]
MKDAGFALAQAYTTLLANLTYQNQPVPLYSLKAPDDAVSPYVILGPWQGQRDNTKQSFGQTGEINLDVVTRFAGDVVSKKAASDIADLITNLITPTPGATLSVPGFSCWLTVVSSTQDISIETDTETLIRKLITVQHSLTL